MLTSLGGDSKKGGSAEGQPTRRGRPLGREQLLGGLPQGRVDPDTLPNVRDSTSHRVTLPPIRVVNATDHRSLLQTVQRMPKRRMVIGGTPDLEHPRRLEGRAALRLGPADLEGV